jgi:hypothetical protein
VIDEYLSIQEEVVMNYFMVLFCQSTWEEVDNLKDIWLLN